MSILDQVSSQRDEETERKTELGPVLGGSVAGLEWLPHMEVLQTIPKFCFPFDVERVSQSQVGQNFTFVLTDIDSKQRFGFCRLTQGCRVCICLLSYLPWFEIYYKLLNTLADYLTKQQENDLNDMLKSLYDLPVPKPFTPVSLSVHSYFIAPDINGLPTIPESRNLTEYFVAVDVNNMLQLYASMLHERRIIITSSKLSTLTACVHGAAAMLFPMYWQHIFIPVLPPHLLDYCCAPMPYFVGVHLSLLERVRSRSLEDVVILNVDTNTLESPSDDLHNLPSDVVSSLKSKLKKQSTATGCGVARAFLRAQAALFGSYRDALRYRPGEPITFCEESFVNHRSSTMRNFLSMAVNLQLFKQFIDGRLAKLNAGRGFTDVFEEEITEGGFCGSNSRSYQQWMHTVKRGGALINTAVTKAKSHAKRGIRDIKGRLKAKEEEEEGMMVCAGSPTSTKSLSPRRLQNMRRQELFHFLLSNEKNVSLVAERKEVRVRQRETVTSVTDSRVMEGENGRQGGMEGESLLHFSPFSSPLADSENLMKEQYDNLLFCFFMLSTVLSGLGRYGMEVELSQL
ncbi:DENN domain-containing protein 1B [Channa argus]|uniref:DENN domain-containing protein 1B n=1 Tax=Channa argus TaxID=215402 RepID=A0A6G1PKK8_CHAAH|nr:DENN domain-containing protein 1B [Channa argus]